jgi:hypothetical protein
VINSDVTGTGSFISGTVTGAGTADVQRYVTGGGSAPNLPWHLIAAPVTGQTVGSFIDLAGNNIALNGTTARYGLAYYDNAASTPAWVYFTAANKGAYGPFVSGKGYSVLSTAPTGYVTFTGNVATANVSPAITFDTNKWWNLVGNPYPSAVNANALADGTNNFLTANDAILGSAYKFLYVWDPTVQNYSPVGNFEAYRIPVGQAFFIRTVSGATSATFGSAMRTHEASSFKGGENTLPSINLKSVIADKNCNAKVYFISGTTAGIDEGYDAGMFEDNNPAIALSTHIQGSDIDFAIQSLPDTDYENTVVSVGLNGPEGANVVFTADVANLPGGTKVYLEDKLMNTFTRLDDGGSYSVELKVASKGTGRFFVHTKQGSMGIDATILSSVKVVALPQEYLIRILGSVEPATQATLYDMNGKVLVSAILRNPTENEIPFMPLSSGIYMLKLQSGTTIKAEKINWVY